MSMEQREVIGCEQVEGQHPKARQEVGWSLMKAANTKVVIHQRG